jgi:hypothetical protein
MKEFVLLQDATFILFYGIAFRVLLQKWGRNKSHNCLMIACLHNDQRKSNRNKLKCPLFYHCNQPLFLSLPEKSARGNLWRKLHFLPGQPILLSPLGGKETVRIRRHDSPRRRCHHAESTHANDKIDQGFESWATYLFIYLLATAASHCVNESVCAPLR